MIRAVLDVNVLLQLKEYETVRIVTPREFLRIIGSR
jgi:predicted nucleic acid-binding protein